MSEVRSKSWIARQVRQQRNKPKGGFIANFKEKAMQELNKKGSDAGEGDDHFEDLYLDKSQRLLLEQTR